MRKLFCTLVIGLLLLSLVACGTKTPPPGQTVKAFMSAAVLVEVMPAAFALAFSGEDAQEEISAMFLGAFVKHIENTEAPMTTSDVTVKLSLKSNSWTIVPDDALVNAITGNLQKVWEELDQGDE